MHHSPFAQEPLTGTSEMTLCLPFTSKRGGLLRETLPGSWKVEMLLPPGAVYTWELTGDPGGPSYRRLPSRPATLLLASCLAFSSRTWKGSAENFHKFPSPTRFCDHFRTFSPPHLERTRTAKAPARAPALCPLASRDASPFSLESSPLSSL